MLRDRVVNLTSPEDVQGFLAQNPTSVIFKAGTCHKTMQGFGFLQEKLEPRVSSAWSRQDLLATLSPR
jgi:hypothetical protein